MVSKDKDGNTKRYPRLFYVLLLLSLLCIGVAIFLGFRSFSHIGSQPLPIPRQTNVDLIQRWMTLPYISKVYGMPREVFTEKLNVPREISPRANINEIAKSLGREPQTLLDEIKLIITEYQNPQSTPQASPTFPWTTH